MDKKMDILEKMDRYGLDLDADLDTNLNNIIYGEEEELELPPRLFAILKMCMKRLSHGDIILYKQFGGERNDIVVNIKPKKFDIRYNDIKTLANKFGLTGLKYENNQIRMWFDGGILWSIIR